MALIASVALSGLPACADPIVPAEGPPCAVPPPATAAPAVNSFELVGGYRLEVAYADEGLALVTDTAGFVIEAIAGAHAQTSSVNRYDLSRSPGTGTDAEQYPLLAPLKTLKVTELFPDGSRDSRYVTPSASVVAVCALATMCSSSPR